MAATSATQRNASAVRQAKIGFVLSHEQFPARDLIEYGVAAEAAGFDMIWCSDHFQPWQDNEGHASLAWLTLSALGQRKVIRFYGEQVLPKVARAVRR